jgi:competence protein ComEA
MNVKRLMPALVAMALVLGLLAWAIVDAWRRPIVLPDKGQAIQPSQANSWPDMRININAASASELSVLPGIGPQLAQRIVDDRQERGPFASVEQLTRVRGIGPAIMSRLRAYAVCE